MNTSRLSPTPSPSESVCSVASVGKASRESAYRSPSVSGPHLATLPNPAALTRFERSLQTRSEME